MFEINSITIHRGVCLCVVFSRTHCIVILFDYHQVEVRYTSSYHLTPYLLCYMFAWHCPIDPIDLSFSFPVHFYLFTLVFFAQFFNVKLYKPRSILLMI